MVFSWLFRGPYFGQILRVLALEESSDLGPEMAAPILWAPGIFWFFLQENPHAHKIPPFRGGGSGFF